MPISYNTSEIWLAENLGIKQNKLSKFRTKNLRRFVDYARKKNGIYYSKSGVDAIKAKFATSLKEITPAKEYYPNFLLVGVPMPLDKGKYLMLPAPSQHLVEDAFSAVESAKKDFPATLKIKTVPRNTRILICLFEGAEAVVHVRENINFIAGMEIPVHRLGERIEFKGKLPRRKGVLVR